LAIAKDHVSVQTGISSGSPVTVTSSTGNLSVVGLSLGPNTSASAVTDSKGNSYKRAGVPTPNSGGNRPLEVWYAANATTGITTVTITFSGGGTIAVGIYDCSGADTNNPLAAYSQSGIDQPATTNPVGPTVQVPTGGGILIAVINASATIASPFTLDGSGLGEGFGSDVNVSSGTFTPSWTISSSTWDGITVAFKSTTGVPLLVVQSAFYSSFPATITSTTAGNLIVIALSSDQTVTGFSDNASGGSNTYVQCPNAQATTPIGPSDVWYAKNIHAGATTVSISASGGTGTTATIWEVSGADTSTPFDIANHANNQTAGVSGPPFLMSNPTLTTNYAQEFIVGCTNNANGITPPSVQDPFITQEQFLRGYSRIVIATGTYNANCLSDTSGDSYNSSIASFKIQQAGVSGQGSAEAITADYQWGGAESAF
jgi:hypothetical protein